MYQSLPGNSIVLWFRPLLCPRTIVSTASIIFDNLPGDGMGAITTFNLNRSYDFTDIGDERTVAETYSSSPGHSVFHCNSISVFTQMFLTLSAEQLNRIAISHYIVVPLACTTNLLVFLKRAYPRSAPFIPHEILVIAVPTQSLTLESMNDLNALPVLFKNDIQVDVEDGITHSSTYLLNSSYDFIEVVNSVTLPTLYHADMGVKFIAVAQTSMSSLVSFYQHLNMKQLARSRRFREDVVDQLEFLMEEIHQRENDIDTVTPEQHLDDIIRERVIGDNPEQLLLVFRLIQRFDFGVLH
ncbi:hypothetical protein C8R44DRAFT_736873 [Mycena epipterygia]|nr:hypothetical protein C8R44DRAFT_736873 [Mycena epipterygia]